MSGGQRQCVAIARTATFASKLIIMDEPTAALGVQETAQVENIIRDAEGPGRAADPDQPQYAPGVRPRRPHRRLPARPHRRQSAQGGDRRPDIVAYITGAKTGLVEEVGIRLTL